jgi:hypothetical protein
VAALLLLVIQLALVALCLYGAVDAVRRPAAAFPAHGKLTKPAWLAILLLSALVLYAFGIISILGLPAIVAAIVYQVDVKPAVSGSANPWD